MPQSNPKTRAVLLFTVVIAFSVLIFGGAQISQNKPPIPGQILAADGKILATGEDIIEGQKLYLGRGGQHMGSVWGHGAYLAPDWSADALHRIALVTAGIQRGLSVEQAAHFEQKDLEALSAGDRGKVEAEVKAELKTNRYQGEMDSLTLSGGQTAAFSALTSYYTQLFSQGNRLMAIASNTVKNAEEGRLLTTFFFWTAWAAGTNRPGLDYTYTANWPFDPLAGNRPLPSALVWSIFSVILLIFGIGAALFVYVRTGYLDEEKPQLVAFETPHPTSSQKVTLAFFVVVMLLFLVQTILGSLTGHYAVEGNALWGFDMSNIAPYTLTRTWHVQLSVFWIATAWLATGLFIGPFVSGKEPKHQALLSSILLGALFVVVVGSLTGTYLGVTGRISGFLGFLFGHQGYEYIELGRVWQIGLIAGMILWLVLVYRSIAPALKAEKDAGGLTHLLLYAAVSIPVFYSVGLFYHPGTHMSVADYWRWWVVHLWVENFFEVFATVTLAFILSRIGAVRAKVALTTVYFSIVLYLGSGIIGTFHHLYFSGSPLFITALGASFSALEVVPLSLLGFEVFSNLKLLKAGGAAYAYKWPIWFFIAVAFWNLVGAGVFGFLINPPIVLYYAQGLNTTPIHSHAALFGVYGFLAIALMLFSMRHIVKPSSWNEKLLKFSFWALNLGLMGMILISLVPAGFYQLMESIRHGIWYARSPAVTASEFIHTVTWLRIGPDIVFLAGVLALFVFVVRAVILECSCQKERQ
ncbi:nitric-oxide reductase large subunit [Bdellovibrionota bacterium FG-1]